MEPEGNMPIVNGKPVDPWRKRAFGFRTLLAGGRRIRLIVIGAATVLLVASGVFAWLLLRPDSISPETPVASVSIRSDGFNPATIKIRQGQEVAWVNEDEVAHEVYALQEEVPGLDSTELLAPGDTYIYVFEEAGTFNYYDPLNPANFKGTVVVE